MVFSFFLVFDFTVFEFTMFDFTMQTCSSLL